MRYLVFILILLLSVKTNSQFAIISGMMDNELNMDDIDIIFENDFENNTIGDYVYSEYQNDWYTEWGFTSPGWNSRRETIDIEQGTDSDNTTKVMKCYYPDGGVGPSETGFQWWVELDQGYDEVYYSYDIFFMSGFQYNIGGKIPGLTAGYPYASWPLDGTDYINASMMFKNSGRVVFYDGYTDCKLQTQSDSYWWGTNYASDYWEPSQLVIEYSDYSDVPYMTAGSWHNITYRIVMNTVSGAVGDTNGILEGYFNGELKMQISNILWRHDDELQIDCIKFYSFFGGSTSEWESPINQHALLDNVLLYTYKQNINVPRGNVLSDTTRTINYWRIMR